MRNDKGTQVSIPDSATRDAVAIWTAGLDSVRGDRLIERSVTLSRNKLVVDPFEEIDLHEIDRVVVLGAGKATAAMAHGLETLWRNTKPRQQLTGWVNVPQGCFDPSSHSLIHRHAARPAGKNEPTSEGLFGTTKILEMAQSTTKRDLVICLISGGASALMPCPIEGVTLEEKLEVTRYLSRNGATIDELNEVRRAISRIKGGGLANACIGARLVVGLILSDVLGDPIHLIGSGPTVLQPQPDPLAAIQILRRFDPDQKLPSSIYRSLQRQIVRSTDMGLSNRVRNYVLANNATAVDAAGVEAVKRGYMYIMESSPRSEGRVRDVANQIALRWKLACEPGNPNCVISGGEPTVTLPTSNDCGKGGRNQHLALEILNILQNDKSLRVRSFESMAMVSAGTDGEDGPTHAAGAILNATLCQQVRQKELSVDDYLKRCDSFHFFERANGLFVTGPTHTNVCDLRVALVAR